MRTFAFVSIDGPKGSGKTTLLHRLLNLIPSSLSVAAYSEKDLDPFRTGTYALIEKYQGSITRDVEMEIVHRLAAGRAAITKSVLKNGIAHIVVMERWYPSDAYFRRCITFSEVLACNVAHGVAQPDLVLAAVCDPRESWRRAISRPRGLASRVGFSMDQHVEASAAFENAINQYGFTRLSTDDPVEIVADRALEAILVAIG